jgi:hypothetical protein
MAAHPCAKGSALGYFETGQRLFGEAEMMPKLPKLPEPDCHAYAPQLGQVGDYWLESSVRAIQEEAYKAGIAAAVPEGWKVVPVEPTIDMCLSGAKARLSIEYPTPAEAAYIAMLSASPELK